MIVQPKGNFVPTVRALCIKTLSYPSGTFAAEEGESLEIGRALTLFYIYKKGVLVYTTDDQGLIYDHLIVDVPLPRIKQRDFSHVR